MTVLVAAGGEPGAVAAERLQDAGYAVERVETFADARVRATTVPVAVVGDLDDATATDLRDALHGAEAGTPLVALAADATGQWDGQVDGPEDPTLAETVQLARQAGAYRDAVDELYEQCRDGADVSDAHERAEEAFVELRRTAGRTPFEQLFDE